MQTPKPFTCFEGDDQEKQNLFLQQDILHDEFLLELLSQTDSSQPSQAVLPSDTPIQQQQIAQFSVENTSQTRSSTLEYFSSPISSPLPAQEHSFSSIPSTNSPTTVRSLPTTPLPNYVTSNRKGTKKTNFSAEEKDLIVGRLRDPKCKYNKKSSTAYDQFLFSFQVNNTTESRGNKPKTPP